MHVFFIILFVCFTAEECCVRWGGHFGVEVGGWGVGEGEVNEGWPWSVLATRLTLSVPDLTHVHANSRAPGSVPCNSCNNSDGAFYTPFGGFVKLMSQELRHQHQPFGEICE